MSHRNSYFDVVTLECKIRDIYNIPRRYRKSQRDRSAFNQACSALDVIGDTELALQEYRTASGEYGKGLTYILVYGVLQALFLQQDAVTHLAESLGLKIERPEELNEVRNLRNEASGHPTRKDLKRGRKSFHWISRGSLTRQGFQLMSMYSDADGYVFKNINLVNLIEIQATAVINLLSKVLDRLRKSENAHRSKYEAEMLIQVFRPSLPYLFEKLSEGIKKSEKRPSAAAAFHCIMQMLSEFRQKLASRKETGSIDHIEMEMADPISELTAYLQDAKKVNQRAAERFSEYIEKKFEELKEIAAEIDKTYQEKI